ncbi:MAG: VCBS repeat-containing protein, partial [Bacteroidota bacterium]|nr:VCBS repeat-containing protein [Bacteroidota bacterium]
MKNKNLLFTVLSILSFQFSFGQFASNSFASQVYFSTGTNIQGITTADLNNDGKKEIITANLNSNTIGIFVNNTVTGIVNNSSFSTYFTCATTLVSGVTPAIVTTADLNGDNKPDIIVGYNNSSYTFFSIFLNQYNGTTFNSSSFTKYDFTAQSGPGGVSVADYDLDGKIDISVANGSSASMSVFRNTSSLSTLSFASALNYSTGTTPGTITSGDIDNDGKIDIAVSNWGSNSITVYRNTSSSVGNISFSLINSVNFFTTQINPNWIKIIDIDNNGLKEVICSNWGSNSISIYSNTSSSGISFNPRVDKSTGSYPQANDAADFDGDGKIDIGLSMAGVTSAGCFKNIHTSGSISASSFSGISYYGVNNSPVGFSATDIDNDLRPDIIVANYSSQNISVLKNKMLANEPTVPSSNVIAIPSTTSVTLNFTKGNGNKRLVVARSSTNAMVSPVDTSFYTANPVFGFGTNIGSSNYIVYGDTGSTVTVTGLSYGQVYNFTIYEYNGIGGFSNYLTSSAVAITQAIGDVYYSKSSGALNLVGTWGPNTDGTGTSPTTFNNPNTVYVVTNNPAPTLTNNWIVSGTNSFIVVGDGINALNFTIPSGTSLFTDSVAVKANATLTFIGGLIGNKAYFDSLSTAQFTSSSPQNIPGFTYYNIVIANSNKTITNNCN